MLHHEVLDRRPRAAGIVAIPRSNTGEKTNNPYVGSMRIFTAVATLGTLRPKSPDACSWRYSVLNAYGLLNTLPNAAA